MIIYGIPNCSSVKKAQKFMESNKIDYQFYNFKKQEVNKHKLQQWFEVFGADKVVNKKGMTWRKLDDEQKNAVYDNASKIQICIEKPSIIKRPIIEVDGKAVAIGFDESQYQKLFTANNH